MAQYQYVLSEVAMRLALWFVLAVLSSGFTATDDSSVAIRSQALLKKSDNGKHQIWSEGDKLTVCYVGMATDVGVTIGGLRHPLEHLGETNVWTWSADFPNLESGILNYSLDVAPSTDSKPVIEHWRGPKAPPPAAQSSTLRGEIRDSLVQSKVLETGRKVTVYLPPGNLSRGNCAVIYATDGQSIAEYAMVLEPLFSRSLPPVVLVGVHSGGYVGERPKDISKYDVSKDLRAVEYLPIIDEDRFQAHAKFFTEEVTRWAETEFGVSSKRELRAVFGFSNGGRFAATMGVEHPDVFGTVLAFSLGSGVPPSFATPPAVSSKFFFASGQWETGFHKNTQAFHDELQKQKVTSRFRSRVSGHDTIMWQEEFAAAVLDAFAKK